MDEREEERMSGLQDQHEQETQEYCLCGELLIQDVMMPMHISPEVYDETYP
jgi:hypothetical protein